MYLRYTLRVGVMCICLLALDRRAQCVKEANTLKIKVTEGPKARTDIKPTNFIITIIMFLYYNYHVMFVPVCLCCVVGVHLAQYDVRVHVYGYNASTTR